MSEKYRRFGLRSDQNLKDLQNSSNALANILNDLDQGYTPKDLLVIEGLRNTAVRTGDIGQLNGLVEEITSNTNVIPIEPLITIKDRIDNLKVVTRDPPYLSGGNGPQAFLIPSSEILKVSQIDNPFVSPFVDTTTGDTLVDLSNPNVIGPIKFWDDGNFLLDIKIAPSFSNTYGGIQWIGYASSNVNQIGIKTTGLYLIEEDPNNTGNWTRLGLNTTINSEPTQFFPITSQITGNLTRIRITMWWPEESDPLLEKSFVFYRNNLQTQLEYTDIYETNIANQIPSKLTYEYFKRFRASEFQQNTSFPFTVENTLRSDYVPPKQRGDKVSSNILLLTYESKGRIKSRSGAHNINVGDWIVFRDSTNSFSLKAEQITEIKDSNTVFYQYLQDDNTTKDILPEFTDFEAAVVQNLGLIGIYELDSEPLQPLQLFEITNSSSLNLLRPGNAFVLFRIPDFYGASIPEQPTDVVFEIRSIEEDGIITADSLYSDDTGSVIPNFAFQKPLVVVYSTQGLEDLSSKNQCSGTFGAEVIDTASVAGDTTIKVSDTSQIVPNSTYIQYKSKSFTNYDSDVIPNDTLVTNVNEQTITLNKPLTGDVPISATVVFIEAEHYESGVAKEFCVLPLNTAPPFTGTNTGLQTTSSYPNIKTPKLTFENLSFNSLVSTEVTESPDNLTFSKTLVFTDNNNETYEFLIN